MNDLIIGEINEELSKFHLTNNLFEKIQNPSFLNHFENIFVLEDFSCKAVLDIFIDILDNPYLLPNNEEWLLNCYKYVLSKSFPHAVDSVFLENDISQFEAFLSLFKIVNKHQLYSKDNTWQSKYALQFLTLEEECSLENPDEYKKFLNAFYQESIYEMMKLNQELLGYNTLDHICGVHYLALHIARQLKIVGLPLDLGRVSGSAAGHDIGKFGCKGSEARRVPYLHYYYTDQWFIKHNITYIRNIAINHSTWDLELENLSLESLILIYSDFRVKNITIDNKDSMHIFTLKDSFEVILNKLDNMDDAKLRRYKKVYAKLKDFENFLLNLNVNVNPEEANEKSQLHPPKKIYNYSLMHGDEIVEHMKYLSIHHNINLMHMLRTEDSLNTILELARSEDGLKNLRQYLQVFEEYSTYLTQKQKIIAIKFLYDELTHSEEDIRKKCAELIGVLIAEFDEDYRKEVPGSAELDKPDITSSELLDKYINLFLNPDHKIIPPHRKWIGYSLSTMTASLFIRAKSNQVHNYMNILLKYFEGDMHKPSEIKLFLLNSAKHIPISHNEDSLEILYNYILDVMTSKNSTLRVLAFDVARIYTLRLDKDSIFLTNLKLKLTNNIKYSRIPSENYLREKLAIMLDLEKVIRDKYASFTRRDRRKTSDIYLSNLKTATEWVIKKIQVEMLLHHSLEFSRGDSFYTAMHFCNLLKVSAIETVRNSAGNALIQLIPNLSHEQMNDVSIELLRGLEIEGHRFSEFIPYSLGQVLLFLNPVELDEIIDDLIEKIRVSDPKIISLLLRTIGITIANYPKYRSTFSEDEDLYRNRLLKLLGVLLNGLVNFNIQVKQMAFRVIGKEIFGSNRLNFKEKHFIFKTVGKKILSLITSTGDEDLMFLSRSAALNHIYRFISEVTLNENNLEMSYHQKVAFFPGTFDPFSLGHKEIVKEIINLGFEVYLAVDEFSWSKQTRPHLIRRNIIEMSIADEPFVYLFPSDIPINIANNRDLDILRRCFPNSSVYIVIGSDVLGNASAYTKEVSEKSIHSFNHILFKRNLYPNKKNKKFNNVLKKLSGEVIKLSLEPQYEEISSTQIRTYIDQNKDITSLVDPLAQRYIYEYGYYQREPQYKAPIQTVSINVEVIENLDDGILTDILSIINETQNEVFDKLKNLFTKPSARIIALRDINDKNRIIAFSPIHWVRTSELFFELKNSMLSEYIRDNAVGRIVSIGGLYTDENSRIKNLDQLILTETLAFSLSRDYDYAIFNNLFANYDKAKLDSLLLLQGFIPLPSAGDSQVYAVDMSSPCTLNLDLKTIIKEPFKSNSNINATIKLCRKRLQEALTKLYPGNLVLSFNRNMLYETLIRKICQENGVPTLPITPRTLSSAMCVPFGSILNRNIVPNTVTKSIHTEKLFAPDLSSYRIGQFPNYLSLEDQVKIIHSFDRPIILVDDILHKGYRIKALDPILKNEKIGVKKIIVGILSGRGKELMDIQGRMVDTAYYIPKLKVWFNENSLYPFMGGDTIWRGNYPERNLIPSINMILPYASPTFIKGASPSSIYNLSKVCIENAREIMLSLEREYQVRNERSLTLGQLGQVFISPRCPEHGMNLNYDLNLCPSHYLQNDLELLKRIEFLLSRD